MKSHETHPWSWPEAANNAARREGVHKCNSTYMYIMTVYTRRCDDVGQTKEEREVNVAMCMSCSRQSIYVIILLVAQLETLRNCPFCFSHDKSHRHHYH